MTGSGLRVELVTDRARIPLSPQRWDALVAANETNTVFQTHAWFDAWWRAFGARRRLFFLAVWRGDEVVGFAPLTLRRSIFGWRLIEFAGTGNADYLDFVTPTDKPAQVAAICRFLRARRFGWERLALYNVPEQSSTHSALLDAAAGSGLRVVDEIRVTCPALVLQPDERVARAMLEKYSLRRPLNWFRRHGEVKFRHVTDIEEIVRLLPAYFEQHRRRWRSVGKPSLFSEARQRSFYEMLARGMHASGWLQFSVVEFNGEPIAFHFGFDYDGCVTWYKPTFDTRYAERSPGLLLTRELIADAVNRGRRELDFTIGDETFKGRLSNHERQNLYFGLYPSALSGRFAAMVGDLRKFAGRTLRRLRNTRVTRIGLDISDPRRHPA